MSDTPKNFRLESEGKVSLSDTADGSLRATADQPLNLALGTIKSIGIENLVDVQTHEINRVFGSVSHYVRFHGGGELRFSYNVEGKLLEFTAQEVTTTVINGERLLIGIKPD